MAHAAAAAERERGRTGTTATNINTDGVVTDCHTPSGVTTFPQPGPNPSELQLPRHWIHLGT